MPAPNDPVKKERWRRNLSESRKVKKIKCVCGYCGKEFETLPCYIRKSGGKYHNSECALKARIGKPLTEEHRKKVSEGQKGKIIPDEQKAKTSARMMGNLIWLGKHHSKESKEKIRNSKTGIIPSEETKKRRSESHKKVIHTQDWRKHQSESLKGRKITWKKEISAAHQGKSLKEWEEFITPLYNQIRSSSEYADWRQAVFERDNFRDWFSGVEGRGNLNAHHIIPFKRIIYENNITTFEKAQNCPMLWNVNNGVTMLKSSHLAYHQMWGDN
jgi:hypothetical protein